MRLIKTENGFQCVITAQDLAQAGIDYHDHMSCTPQNPKYQTILQAVMHAAVTQRYIEPGGLAAVDCIQNFDEERECIILDFTEGPSITTDEMTQLVNKDIDELMQAMKNNPDLQEEDSEEFIQRLQNKLEEIYHRNHPEETAEDEDNVTDIDFVLEAKHLNQVIDMCVMLPDFKTIKSTLYKNNGSYYLLLHIAAADFDKKTASTIDMTITESDMTCVPNKPGFTAYLFEHGDVICKNAISALKSIRKGQTANV